MTGAEARRAAHKWVSDVIYGALGNGSFDDLLINEPMITEEIEKIRLAHERKGQA
jgi:hypothetical protein